MGYRTNVTTTPSALSAADAASGRGWFYTYDGNGNVSEVFGDTGESLATYLYDPFGNVAWEAGPVARENRWRFSTKLEDAETRLYYYGFRYYSAEMGRWLGRDPIGEEGGGNLYGFVGNGPNSKIDYLGMIGGTGIGGPQWPIHTPQPPTTTQQANSEFYRLLKQFLGGTSTLSYTYNDTHPWTEALKEQPPFERLREFLQEEADFECRQDGQGQRKGTWDVRAVDYGNSPGANPWITASIDGLNYIIGWKLKSLGGLEVQFEVTDLDCSKCTFSYKVEAQGEFRAGSAMRIPGTDGALNLRKTIDTTRSEERPILVFSNSALADNPFGATSSPLNSVDVKWIWEEEIYY